MPGGSWTRSRARRATAREQVLAQTAGNPLALIELAKMLADPDTGYRWAADRIHRRKAGLG